MLWTISRTCALTILQSLIDEDKVGRIDYGDNKTNLLNLSASKRFIGVGYPTSKATKFGNGNINSNNCNTKKSFETAKNFDYLTLDTKKTFNH